MSTVQKRLHISGLTPAITANDINVRLHGFGKVLALDGFGALNAVGVPRKFAYVTLEATEINLARCLNVLSGTTWKGTKLRLGEAKPDYTQRLESERKRAAEDGQQPQPKRRRLPRGVQGVHAKNMSNVDTSNIDSHQGWHKTTLSHLIHPMKMRPSRPLPEPIGAQRPDSAKKKLKKTNPFDVPTRARVRTIDPRLYGAVHLRDDMLQEVVIDSHVAVTRRQEENRLPPPRSSIPEIPSVSKLDLAAVPVPPPTVEYDEDFATPNLTQEKAQQLSLLTSMFGDEDSEWGGKESLDDDDDNGKALMSDIISEKEVSAEPAPAPMQSSVPERPKVKSLKDMFKPQEEPASFSLLAGLGDLDLDLDLDLDPAFDPQTHQIPVPDPASMVSVTSIPTAPQQGTLTIDPTLPLFFPQPDNPRAKDLFSLARTEGWEFGRSGDADAIRKRWDETKGSLTREWKKRSREAVKARRRRFGAAEGEDT